MSSMASTTSKSARESGLLVVGYILLIVVAIGLFAVIRQTGQGLSAPEAANATAVPAATAGHSIDVVLHVLITLAVIVTLGNLLAVVFRKLGQPAVIGEVIAGILLGPSYLGLISPTSMNWLIPDAVADPNRLVIGSLKTISQLGVILYMFIVGLELNMRKVGNHAKAAIAISHFSIVIPFISGAGLALWLYPLLSSSNVPFTSFALFLGVAMSITAFPVLARILTDRRLDKTDLGVVALSCAATDDVTAWCLLALVVGVAKAQIGGAMMVAVYAGIYIAVMFFVLRPLAQKWVEWAQPRNKDLQAIPFLFVAVLCSALATEAIGIHAVFGAFLLGAIIPCESRIAQELCRKLQDVVTILLLPAFFAVTGLNTRIGLISGFDNWLICLAIIGVATFGKFGGTVLASRLAGMDWRMSGALGILMNTRGLMELIVLNIGLSMGVISPKLFAMMVIMAIVTTVATSPILARLVPETVEQHS